MAGKKKPEPAKAAKGHNSGIDPKREAVFIREFQNLKNADAALAGKKGEMNAMYKRLSDAGFQKEHIAFAKTLEKRNVAEVIADFEMKIAICRIMGHAAGRQLDMLDKDRTPIEDQAYEDGLSAGKLGRSATNPYGMETVAGQRWQQGMNEGNAFRNKALNEAINGSELITGGDEGDGDEDGDEQDDAEEDDGQEDDGEESSSADDDDWENAAPTAATAH